MDPFTRYRSHPPESRNHRVGVSSHEKAWVDNLRKDRQISGQRHPTNSLCGLSEEKGEKEETEETVPRKGVKWNTMEYLLCFLVASATNSGSETKGTMFDSIQTPLAQASKKTSSETVRVPTADGLWHMKKVLPLCIQTFRPRKTGKLLSAGSVCQHMYI